MNTRRKNNDSGNTSVAKIKPLPLGGEKSSSTYEDEDALYCRISSVTSEDPGLPRSVQAEKVFGIIDKTLENNGFSFNNVVRTWFYLDHIHEWYSEFNVVRNSFFEKKGLYGRMLPASTGIGLSNPYGTAIVAHAFAVKPKRRTFEIIAVPSPLQCPALDYKSAFSRAIELKSPDRKYLFISGTASIAPDGKTVHIGDAGAQISLTLDVVSKILESRGMDWKNICQSIAYFSDMQDVTLFRKICSGRKIPDFPLDCINADICRPDLLFELEADANQ